MQLLTGHFPSIRSLKRINDYDELPGIIRSTEVEGEVKKSKNDARKVLWRFSE